MLNPKELKRIQLERKKRQAQEQRGAGSDSSNGTSASKRTASAAFGEDAQRHPESGQSGTTPAEHPPVQPTVTATTATTDTTDSHAPPSDAMDTSTPDHRTRLARRNSSSASSAAALSSRAPNPFGGAASKPDAYVSSPLRFASAIVGSDSAADSRPPSKFDFGAFDGQARPAAAAAAGGAAKKPPSSSLPRSYSMPATSTALSAPISSSASNLLSTVLKRAPLSTSQLLQHRKRTLSSSSSLPRSNSLASADLKKGYPLDMSLKALVRFTSFSSFGWCTALRSSETACGLFSFVQNTLATAQQTLELGGASGAQTPQSAASRMSPRAGGAEGSSSSSSVFFASSANAQQPTSMEKALFYRALCYWCYPAAPRTRLLAKFAEKLFAVSANVALSAEASVEARQSGFFSGEENTLLVACGFAPTHIATLSSDEQADALQIARERQSWLESFASAYQMLRNGLCPYFYLVTDESCVLFVAGETGGTQEVLVQFSRSTRGLRAVLEEAGTEFDMPLLTREELEQQRQSVLKRKDWLQQFQARTEDKLLPQPATQTAAQPPPATDAADRKPPSVDKDGAEFVAGSFYGRAPKPAAEDAAAAATKSSGHRAKKQTRSRMKSSDKQETTETADTLKPLQAEEQTPTAADAEKEEREQALREIAEMQLANEIRVRVASNDLDIDNTPRSLLVFRGTVAVAEVFDLIFNGRVVNRMSAGAPPPAIYSPTSFANASLKHAEIKQNGVLKRSATLGASSGYATGDDSNAGIEQIYTLELAGPILPTGLYRLVQVLKATQGGDFEVTMRTNPLSHPLNAPLSSRSTTAAAPKGSTPSARQTRLRRASTATSNSSSRDGEENSAVFSMEDASLTSWDDESSIEGSPVLLGDSIACSVAAKSWTSVVSEEGRHFGGATSLEPLETLVRLCCEDGVFTYTTTSKQ